jgi:hypothetical protein
MTASLLKNFNSMASLMPFRRASLRQTMIRKLAGVDKDKDGWKKADDQLTTLMDQEHMITLEDTEAALKRCEQHLQRAATDDASPKAKVLATEISEQDTAAELAALKATTKAQDAKIKALSAQLRGDTSGAKRARNCVPVEKKPIPVCTVCSKRGHNAVDCWDKLDADQAKLDLAKAARDKKKADMSKRQPSRKETKAYTATVASNKALATAAAASDSDYSTCHSSLHGCVFDQEFVPHTPGTVLDSGAQVNILEGTLRSGTLSLQVSQALQPRLKEQMPCSPYSPQRDRATLFQFVARLSSPHARQITSCLLPSCSRQDTKSNFALARTLTPLMVATCTRQRVSALLSFSLAISGGFQCGAHPHDVRVLPVSLLIKIHSCAFEYP